MTDVIRDKKMMVVKTRFIFGVTTNSRLCCRWTKIGFFKKVTGPILFFRINNYLPLHGLRKTVVLRKQISGLVAQLNRAPDYGSGGFRFES